MLKYRAYRVQRGRGLGNILGKLLRSAIPLLKKGGTLLTPHAARFGSRVLGDVADGSDVLESVKKRARQSGTDIVGAVVKTQKGKGGKHANTKPSTKQPRRKKTRGTHMRSAPQRKITKAKPHVKTAKKSRRKPPAPVANINDVFKYGY
jgi:hypothetical protein